MNRSGGIETPMKDEVVALFHEDEVYRLDKKGNLVFGTVVRDYEMMNMDDSDEEESSYLKKGEVLVSWYPKYTEKVHPNISLELGNRSLMPGDVVRKISSSSGGARSQTGYCREIKVKATVAVKCSNNRVIYNVDSSDLKPIHRFPSNSAVCLEPWVGVIRKIRLRLTLAFHDGISQCIVEDGAIASFEDVNDKEQKIPPFLKRLDYYPGMTLLGPLMVFEGAEWIACSDKLRELRDRKSKKPVKVTVLKAEVKEVSVNWQCQAFIDKVGSDPESGAPDLIVGEDLMKAKILGHFQSCTVQIGDRSYYTIKEDDVIISKNEWLEREKKLFVEGRRRNDDSRCSDESEAPTTHINPKRKVSLCVNKLKGRPLKKRSKNIASELSRNLPSPYNHVIPSLYPGETVVVEVLRTKAEVDVIWQDGSLEKGIDSSELFPMHHLDDNEFFTGEFVVKASDLGGLQTYGVIQSLDYQTRITKVKWFRTYTIGSEPNPISDGETEESVYDLRDHPDFNYRPGSVVIKVANFDNEEFEVGLGGEVVEVYPNGKVAVSWANKKMTECWPQDLYKVGEYDSDDGELWDDDSDYDPEEKEDNEFGKWEVTNLDQFFKPTKMTEDNEEEKDEGKSEISKNCSRVLIFGIFEKTRTALQNLEENFFESSKPQSSAILGKLWDIYKDCCILENAIGTSYFTLENFSDIIDRTSGKWGKVAGNKLAVQDQISRLFNNNKGDSSVDKSLENSSSPEDQDKFNENTCRRICSMFKSKLASVYDVIVEKYGTMIPEVSILEEIQQDKELDTLLSLNGLTYDDISPALPKKGEEIQAPSVVVEEEEGSEKSVFAPEEVSSPLAEVTPIASVMNFSPGTFCITESAPEEHTYKVSLFAPLDMKNFLKFVKKEAKLLSSSLPSGILLKAYEDRIDLFSALIKGPPGTPYQDGLFFFDFQLPPDYPKSPPACFYLSFCSERLNPNLYEEGKVCVSLLGTWSGKGTETWTPNSNLLQLLLSIQGLILVKEPYFNEAGYESQKSTKFGQENSWMYNEMVVIKMVQSMTRILGNPPSVFREEILEHMNQHGKDLLQRWKEWLEVSSAHHSAEQGSSVSVPQLDFPLLPASKGFCVSLSKALKGFELALQNYTSSNPSQAS